MVIIVPKPVLGHRTAVTYLDVNILMLDSETFQVLFLDMLDAIARAKEKPDLALGVAFDNRVGHAQHRSYANSAGDQHDRFRFRQIEEKISAGRFGVEDVAFLDLIAKITRSRARRHTRLIGWRQLLFDGDAIIIRMIRTVGNRVTPDERLVAARNLQLESQILSGFESGQRLAIVGCQIKR